MGTVEVLGERTRAGRIAEVAVPVTLAAAHAPYVVGPSGLELSPDTGRLVTHYAGRFDAHAVDINPALIENARRNLRLGRLTAERIDGDVQARPSEDDRFDTLPRNVTARDGAAAAKPRYPRGYRRVPKPADECGRMPEPDSGIYAGTLALRAASGDVAGLPW